MGNCIWPVKKNLSIKKKYIYKKKLISNENKNIPQIIHQIWIGPKKKPVRYMKTWYNDYINMFPHFKYVFWDDKKIRNLLRKKKKLLDLYDMESTYYGKADIARYFILYKYGGIYIDADSVWINNSNLDDLTNISTGFFICREPNTDLLANGVFGASKKHLYLKAIISYLVKLHPKYINIRSKNQPWKVTGPKLTTKIYKNKICNITIYPDYYFYPISWHGITNPNLHNEIDLPKDSYMFQYGISTNYLNY